MTVQEISIDNIFIDSFLIPESSPELGKPFGVLFPAIYPLLKEVLPGEYAFTSQERSAEFMFKGQGFLLNPETSGGKTEGVLFPAFERLYLTKHNQLSEITPMGRLLGFFPNKALLQTCHQRLGQRYQITERLKLKFIRYDGDFDSIVKEKRRKIAVEQQPEILLTTPDQFYMSLCQGEGKWLEFLLNIDTLWIDELDMYSGKSLFNLELLVKLLRLHHEVNGRTLQVVITGATILQPQHIIERFLHNGVVISGKGQHGDIEVALFQIPKSTNSKAYRDAIIKIHAIIEQIIVSNKKFLVFVDPRFSTELLALEKRLKDYRVASLHAKLDSGTKQRFLEQFRTDKLQGLICTSLLEVGIDIGNLEHVVLFGIPFEPQRGSLQRIGRVARRCGMHGNVTIILPRDDRVCNYYAINPDELKALLLSETALPQKPLPLYDCVEECVMAFISLALKLGITNVDTLQRRLLPDNEPLFTRALTELFCEGAINEINGKLIPTCDLTLSSVRLNNRFRECGEVYTLFHKGKNIGEIEKRKVPICALPDCYFLHGGNSYKVVAVSNEAQSIDVELCDTYYLSHNKTVITVHQDCVHQMKHPNYTLTYGPCKITETVETLCHKNLQDDKTKYKRLSPPFSMDFDTWGISLEFTKSYKPQLIQFFKNILELNVPQIGVQRTHLITYYTNNRLYIVDRDGLRGAALFLFHHFTELIDLLASPHVRFVLIHEREKLRTLLKDLKGSLCKVW